MAIRPIFFVSWQSLFVIGLFCHSAFAAAANFQDEFDQSMLTSDWVISDGFADQYPADTLNHADFTMTGAQLSISFPGGREHNQWWLQHAQVTRTYNGDAVYEIKMDTPLDGSQQFGLVFESAPGTFMMFMIYATDQVNAYVERFSNVDGVQYRNTVAGLPLGLSVPDAGPYYLRVYLGDDADPTKRSWKFDWSKDGVSWNEIVSGSLEGSDITTNIGTIENVGLFAGNQPTGFDAFNARFDYFHSYATTDDLPLQAPSGLVALGSDQQVNLWWESIDVAQSYNVYGSTVAGGPYSLLANTVDPHYSDLSVINDSPYYYVVTALRADGESANSAEVSGTPHSMPWLLGLPSDGLVLALNANELGYQLADGDAVRQWISVTDPLSGSAPMIASGTAGQAPRFVVTGPNGQSAVRFDGVDDFLALGSGWEDFTAGVSIYVVARPTVLQSGFKVLALGNGPSNDNIVLGRAGNGASLQYFTANNNGSVSWFNSGDALMGGETALFSVKQGGGSVNSSVLAEVSKNSSVVGNGNVYVPPITTRSINYIGKSYWNEGMFQGDITEILVYNRALSAAEQNMVQGYFDQKYGLGISFPPSSPPLAIPADLTATASDASVSLSWGTVNGALGYKLYRAENTGGPYTEATDITETSYVDSTAINGRTYYYVVSAYDSEEVSAVSNEVSASPEAAATPLPLATPNNITAISGDGSASLAWDAVTGALGYRVYRTDIADGLYTKIADIATNSFEDSGLVNATAYYYAVSAYDVDEESSLSTEVMVVPATPAPELLPAPLNPLATAGDNHVSLSWGAVSAASGYRIYRTDVEGGLYVQIADTSTESYVDYNVVNGGIYYYVVTAFDAVQESVQSLEVSAAPSPVSSPALPTAGLVLSLNAGSVALDYNAGDAVLLWQDGSEFASDAVANAATAPTLVMNAIGGKPALRFDGVNDYFSLGAGFQDFTAGVSLFIVARPTVLQSGFKLLALGNGPAKDNIVLGRAGASSGLQYFTNNRSNNVGWFNTGDALVAGESLLVSVVQGGGEASSSVFASMAKNGIAVGGNNVWVPEVKSRNHNYIGKSYWDEGMFQGDIAEIILYDRMLSIEEQTSIQNYLSKKYGLPTP